MSCHIQELLRRGSSKQRKQNLRIQPPRLLLRQRRYRVRRADHGHVDDGSGAQRVGGAEPGQQLAQVADAAGPPPPPHPRPPPGPGPPPPLPPPPLPPPPPPRLSPHPPP